MFLTSYKINFFASLSKETYSSSRKTISRIKLSQSRSAIEIIMNCLHQANIPHLEVFLVHPPPSWI